MADFIDNNCCAHPIAEFNDEWIETNERVQQLNSHKHSVRIYYYKTHYVENRGDILVSVIDLFDKVVLPMISRESREFLFVNSC